MIPHALDGVAGATPAPGRACALGPWTIAGATLDPEILLDVPLTWAEFWRVPTGDIPVRFAMSAVETSQSRTPTRFEWTLLEFLGGLV